MDLILLNAKVITMDSNNTIAQSVAIKDGKIVNVGRNEEILNLKNSDTKVIDLKEKLVLPSFNDSHMHLINYGNSITNVDLVGVKSIEEIQEKVYEFIKEKNIPKGKWVRGRGWNQDYFKGAKEFPTRYDLDKISTDHPIVLTRACEHVAVGNSKALELIGVNKNTMQVDGGKFDVDNDNEPLGIFRENALGLIYNALPNPTVEEIKDLILKAVNDLNKCGITSVGTDDFESLPGKDYEKVIKAYKELKEENKLNMRVYEQCLLPSKNKLLEFLEKGYKTGLGDENFKIGPLKILLDGSLGARTAALNQPYSDCPSAEGIVTLTQEELDEIVDLAHKNNMQLAIHAIGDRTMYMAFNSIEKLIKENVKENYRHGIVHCQITDEYLLNKFKELDVIAYIQPIFLDYDWHIVKDRVGEKREKTSYNWKSLINKGVKTANGSDAPVETFNVLKGIYEAVTRKDLYGLPEGGWLPDQKLTVKEAVYGYTMGGAYASFEENIKGSIEKGKLADLVVLSEDIFSINEDMIKNVNVEMTVFNGKIVHEI